MANESREAEFILTLEFRIISLLEKAYLDVPELCLTIGMSQTSLYRKVKSITGDSVLPFIRKIKIKRAAYLLLNSDMTVTEVYYAMYFQILSTLENVYTQYDLAPTEYKHQHSENTIGDIIRNLKVNRLQNDSLFLFYGVTPFEWGVIIPGVTDRMKSID